MFTTLAFSGNDYGGWINYDCEDSHKIDDSEKTGVTARNIGSKLKGLFPFPCQNDPVANIILSVSYSIKSCSVTSPVPKITFTLGKLSNCDFL